MGWGRSAHAAAVCMAEMVPARPAHLPASSALPMMLVSVHTLDVHTLDQLDKCHLLLKQCYTSPHAPSRIFSDGTPTAAYAPAGSNLPHSNLHVQQSPVTLCKSHDAAPFGLGPHLLCQLQAMLRLVSRQQASCSMITDLVSQLRPQASFACHMTARDLHIL